MVNGKQAGFTLIELLIVIAIIGIIAAVLIPNLIGARTRAFDTEALACAKGISTAAATYTIDFPNYGGLSLAYVTANGGNNCGDTDLTIATLPLAAGAIDFSVTVKHAAGPTTFTVTPAGITK